MSDHSPRKSTPHWWPECPYFESAFPMTIDEYVAAVPDPQLRTAISGYLMRQGWCVFEMQLMKAIKDYELEITEANND